MTFSAVGTITTVSANPFSLTPSTVGDFVLLSVVNASNNTVSATSASSTNVTWSALTASVAGTTNAATARTFIGKVTAASAANVTISWSGTAPSVFTGVVQEFSSTNGFTAVQLDTSAMLDNAGTTTWPSLTPRTNSELYFGFASDSATASGGSTTGYVYQINGQGDGAAYRLSCPGGTATGPVWGDGTQQFGQVALLTDIVTLPAWPRRALWFDRAYKRTQQPVPTAAKPANVTSLDSGGLGTNTNSSQTTNSVSPAANSLLVLWVNYSLSGGTTVSTVTTTLSGVTFTQRTSVTVSSSTKIDCWTAVCGAAPGTGTVTINFAASNATRAYDLDQVTGENQAVPLITSNTLTATGGSGTNPALAMHAPAYTGDLYLFGIGVSGSITTVSPNESPAWTQLTRQAFSSPSVTLETQISPNVANTTAGASFSSPAVWGAIGIEVNMSQLVIVPPPRRTPSMVRARSRTGFTKQVAAAPAIPVFTATRHQQRPYGPIPLRHQTQRPILAPFGFPLPIYPDFKPRTPVPLMTIRTRFQRQLPPPLRVSGPVQAPAASRPRIPAGWVRPSTRAQAPITPPHPVAQPVAGRRGWARSRAGSQLPLLVRIIPFWRRARVQAGIRKMIPAQLPPPPVVITPAVLPPRAAPVRARWLGARTRPAPQLAPVVVVQAPPQVPPAAQASRARLTLLAWRRRVQQPPAAPVPPASRQRTRLAGLALRRQAQRSVPAALVPQPTVTRARLAGLLTRRQPQATLKTGGPVAPAPAPRARQAPPLTRRQLQLPVQPGRVIAGLRSVIRLPGWIRRQPPRQMPPAVTAQVQQGTAVLQAPSTLSVQASAGPDLANLWLAYLAAEAHANQLSDRWAQIIQAGGSGWAAAAYSIAYQAQIAAGNAYAAYVNAYHQVNKSPPGDPPLPTA